MENASTVIMQPVQAEIKPVANSVVNSNFDPDVNNIKNNESNQAKKNKLDTLIFYVTNRCNFKCNHCFYWDSLNKQETLSFETIKKIIDGVGELNTVFVAGGEPFLRKELPEICEYLIEKAKVKLISIPTNGSMGSRIKELVKRISSKVRLRIYISLDGLKQTHNEIRQVDSFDTCIKVLKELVEMKKEYNFSPLAMITVSNKNLQEIVPLGQLLSGMGVHYSVTPVRGTPKDSAIQPPTSQEWGKLTDELTATANFKGGISSFYNNATNPLKKLHRKILTNSKKKMYQDALDGKRNYICKAGDEIGVIDYDGSVLFCELTKKIGNLKDYDWDFNKLWFSKEAEEYRPQVQTCVCTHGCFIKTRYMRAAAWLTDLLSVEA